MVVMIDRGVPQMRITPNGWFITNGNSLFNMDDFVT
jgi:hypothetical protein